MACKPGSVRASPHGAVIHLGCALLRTSCDQPEQQGGNTLAAMIAHAAGYSYSVLLPVGFTLPPLLPRARCALAAPFHPYPQGLACGRYIFCGTFPGVAPAGR